MQGAIHLQFALAIHLTEACEGGWERVLVRETQTHVWDTNTVSQTKTKTTEEKISQNPGKQRLFTLRRRAKASKSWYSAGVLCANVSTRSPDVVSTLPVQQPQYKTLYRVAKASTQRGTMQGIPVPHVIPCMHCQYSSGSSPDVVSTLPVQSYQYKRIIASHN
eukprot:1648510-Rhodomonas_salina.1